MEEERMDFVKRFDDYIDGSPDHIRDVAKLFYELGLADGKQSAAAVMYIPFPVADKKYWEKFKKER